ncbi:MAG TPA: serine hydrolase domain-containing protein [Arachidicoccus sp.]|nr:serine hydrolase domain-containing protein [Arachidicoccus sp.]
MKKLIVLFVLILNSFSRPTIFAQSHKKNDNVWNAGHIAAFERKIESLRERYHIPGLSAGIVYGRKLVWTKGFGFSDVERQVVPDENTVYQIASVTKTFGSILLMQLVEEGKISLDDPISKYGINLGARWGSDNRIKLKHLLTHTAMGRSLNGYKPGYSFRYNGAWYNELGKAIEKASGQTFASLVMKNIILPLHLKSTVPSTDDSVAFSLTGYDKMAFVKKVAKPYDWQNGRLAPIKFSYGFGPAAGLMSCVSDLATYSIAIDDGKFLDSATWKKVFTPFVSPKGHTFQYGLGWFIKNYKGVKVVWHTGWWTGYSALLVKIPEKDLTFIILANSQDLSRPFYHIIHPLPSLGMFNPFYRNLNNTLLGSAFGKAFWDDFAEL